MLNRQFNQFVFNVHAILECAPRNGKMCRYLRDGPEKSPHRKTIMSARLSSIVNLLKWCGPSAVFLAVIAVIILAINAHSDWPFAHIGEEVFKGCKPSLADLNSTTSVVGVFVIIFVEASALESRPYGIGGSPKHSVLSLGSGGKALSTEASATFHSPSCKVSDFIDSEFTALAFADPSRPSFCHSVEGNNGESSKYFSREVNVTHKPR